MVCVDKIRHEHLAILSNLKSCQFAPRIVIFNLCICCQFEYSQIISPKIIPTSHHNIYCDKWGPFFCRNIFSFLWYIIQNFWKTYPRILVSERILMHSRDEWVKARLFRARRMLRHQTMYSINALLVVSSINPSAMVPIISELEFMENACHKIKRYSKD